MSAVASAVSIIGGQLKISHTRKHRVDEVLGSLVGLKTVFFCPSASPLDREVDSTFIRVGDNGPDLQSKRRGRVPNRCVVDLLGCNIFATSEQRTIDVKNRVIWERTWFYTGIARKRARQWDWKDLVPLAIVRRGVLLRLNDNANVYVYESLGMAMRGDDGDEGEDRKRSRA